MITFIHRKEVAIGMTILWMALIFFLSHQPASESSELSSHFLLFIHRMISFFSISIDIEWLHFFVRKGAHFFAYFVLGILILHSLKIGRKIDLKLTIIALSLSMLYAISDEVHQLFIPGRSGEMRDVLIDTSGALTGIVLYSCILHIIKKVS